MLDYLFIIFLMMGLKFERDFIITLLPIGLIIRILVSLHVAVHSELLHLV